MAKVDFLAITGNRSLADKLAQKKITRNMLTKKASHEGVTLKKVGAIGVAITSKDRFETDFQQKVVKDYTEHLPTITDNSRLEITLRKKLKTRVMLAQGANESALSQYDRQVLDELRKNLRTNPSQHPHGSTSVLEAMADPKIRQSQLYYEPLHKLASHKLSKKRQIESKQTSRAHRMFHKAEDIKLLNVMIPPSQQHFNTPMTAISSHFTNERLRSNTSGNFRNSYPKLINQIPAADVSEKLSKQHYSLSPTTGDKSTESEHGTQINLPAISLKVKSGSQATKRHNENNKNTSRHNAPTKMQQELLRQRNLDKPTDSKHSLPKTKESKYRPNQMKTTANGKAHLISPMNKMDMIVEYSKLLQEGTITYAQYIKKLSVLSLHKIDLANSGARQYHIVRDKSDGMKPRLARVDILPHNTLTSRHDGATTAAVDAFSSTLNPRINKDGSMWVSRISIGEQQHPDAYHNTFGPERNYLTTRGGTNIDRYRQLINSRALDRNLYNWSHAPHTSDRRGRPVVRDIHTDYAGKLPESREMKKRMNFSYPSYDVLVDGRKNQTGERVDDAIPEDNIKSSNKNEGDPDYLAINLETPRSNVQTDPTSRQQITPSLSVHEVTLPQTMTTVTGVNLSPQKSRTNNTSPTRESKMRDASSSPMKGNFNSLNITNSQSSNKQIAKIDEDIEGYGADGVLQSHLKRIFTNLNNKKASKPIIGITTERKVTKSPPSLGSLISSHQITNTLEAKPKEDVGENDKNTTASTNNDVKNLRKTSLLSIGSTVPNNSPPPTTAHILQSREDEITSDEGASVFEVQNGVIKVSVTPGGSKTEETKEVKKLDIVINNFPSASESSP